MKTVYDKLFTVYHAVSDSKETFVNQFVVVCKLELIVSKFCFVVQKFVLTEERHDHRELTVFDRLCVCVLTLIEYNDTLLSHVTVSV